MVARRVMAGASALIILIKWSNDLKVELCGFVSFAHVFAGVRSFARARDRATLKLNANIKLTLMFTICSSVFFTRFFYRWPNLLISSPRPPHTHTSQETFLNNLDSAMRRNMAW